MRLHNLRSYLFVLAVLPLLSIASESWTVEFENTATADVFGHIEKMFRFKPMNPEASCLTPEISFYSDKRWTIDTAPNLIREIMTEAGCSRVTFERFSYTVDS